jgi:hypothetical protein
MRTRLESRLRKLLLLTLALGGCGRTLTAPVPMCRVGERRVGDTTVIVVSVARLVPCDRVPDDGE